MEAIQLYVGRTGPYPGLGYAYYPRMRVSNCSFTLGEPLVNPEAAFETLGHALLAFKKAGHDANLVSEIQEMRDG